MEVLENTEEKRAAAGMPNFGPTLTITYENHGGPGLGAVAQWDAAAEEWNLITEFRPSDKSVIQPLIDADSAAYAAENNITERCN